jgi:hypothetical protein
VEIAVFPDGSRANEQDLALRAARFDLRTDRLYR